MARDVFICDAVRTPIGRYGGALAKVRTDDLAAVPIRALMARNPKVDWAKLEEVYYGCANQAGEDNRNVARMHTLPSEISSSIGTSTLLAAWNAAIYVGQVEDDRLSDVNSDRRYIEATRDVLQKHGGLWFYDESFVISRRRE